LIRGAVLAAALCAATGALAGVRTTVSLAGKDDAIPKLGVPGIAVKVEGPDAAADAAVGGTLGVGLKKLVYTRPLSDTDPGDYALSVTVDERRAGTESVTVPFHAALDAADGRRLWRIEGHADLEGTGEDSEIFASVARNVLSALIHDGWVQPRYDVNDPPPQAPSIRVDDKVAQR